MPSPAVIYIAPKQREGFAIAAIDNGDYEFGLLSNFPPNLGRLANGTTEIANRGLHPVGEQGVFSTQQGIFSTYQGNSGARSEARGHVRVGMKF